MAVPFVACFSGDGVYGAVGYDTWHWVGGVRIPQLVCHPGRDRIALIEALAQSDGN